MTTCAAGPHAATSVHAGVCLVTLTGRQPKEQAKRLNSHFRAYYSGAHTTRRRHHLCRHRRYRDGEHFSARRRPRSHCRGGCPTRLCRDHCTCARPCGHCRSCIGKGQWGRRSGCMGNTGFWARGHPLETRWWQVCKRDDVQKQTHGGAARVLPEGRAVASGEKGYQPRG
jgi:hypothetical protein